MGLIQKQYEDLRKKIKKTEMENQARAFKETRNRQKQNLAAFGDLEKIKAEVKRIRSESVGNWDLLEKAISQLEKNKFKVLQAKDAKEACDIVLNEMGEERLVVKSKSNISKEIRLTSFLTRAWHRGDRNRYGRPDRPDCRPSGLSLHRTDCPSHPL